MDSWELWLCREKVRRRLHRSQERSVKAMNLVAYILSARRGLWVYAILRF